MKTMIINYIHNIIKPFLDDLQNAIYITMDSKIERLKDNGINASLELDNKINNTLDFKEQLEKNLTDRVNDINSVVLSNKDEIGYINNELDSMSEKTITNINLELTELRRIIENNDKRIDNETSSTNNAFDDVARDIIKVEKRIKELEPSELHQVLQTPFNDDNDVFVKRCAEQETELDEVKKENKELMFDIDKAFKSNKNLVKKNKELKETIDKERNNLDDRISKDGEVIKELKKSLDEERSKEAYINTILKEANKELVKEKNQLMVKYKALKNNINLTNEKE